MTALEHLMEQEKADKRFWLSTSEVCALRGCCRGTVWKLWKQGILDSRKIGRHRKFIKASVYSYLRTQVGR